ncbi:PIG-L family deacetylase [Paenibacillus sp. TRM 82003]|nr:PIG-L family deacetylase [Paenibacillus sp. TRM 82003]
MANVLFSYAHPDDETFLSAALIRRLADAGDPPALLLATRGDAGNNNGAFAHYSREALGALREAEMRRAADILGVGALHFLGLPDGKLHDADEGAFLQQITNFIRDNRPHTVFTFPPDGGNFHKDHMAISRVTTMAVASGACPSVERLYYVMSDTLASEGRRPTFAIDTEPHWPTKAEALRAHESQILAIERYFGKLDEFPEARRFETFVLAWERGAHWPEKSADAALLELGLGFLDPYRPS